MKIKSGGMAASMAPAATRLLLTKNSPWRLLRALVIGRLSPLFINMSAQKKSLYMKVNSSVPTAANAGLQSGSITLHQMRRMLAPSTRADSVISLLMVFM